MTYVKSPVRERVLGMAALTVLLTSSTVLAAETKSAALIVQPTEIQLSGERARQQLLVSGGFGNGQFADVTGQAGYESLSPTVADVTPQGLVLPRSHGETQIVVRHSGHEVRVPVTVCGLADADPIDFRTDVMAAFSRAGCNQGSCHGSPQGKHGFRLSLRGFDPDVDFFTLTHQDGGRRTNVLQPEASLILLKGAGSVPHQGGTRFKVGEAAHRTLLAWIGEGCRDSAKPRKLVQLEVLPGDRRLPTDFPRQQLVAVARFDDGLVRDVTDLCVFTTSPSEAVDVSPGGLVSFSATAEAAVLVRYLDQVRSVRLTYVRHDPNFVYTGPQPAGEVDRHVFAKQQQLQLTPAAVADDAVFLRRVHLDVIGTLPTAAEAREFLDSKAPDKRAKLIDRLLERDEFASFWALKWADVMRGNRDTISERGVHSFHRYLVRHFAEDRPFDVLAREVLTGLGNTLHKPAAGFYRVATTPEEAAEASAQLFLGLRIQCARCHNHPFEAITQADYYGLAAYFARVKTKGKQFMLDDEIVYLARQGEVQHPLTRKNLEPAAFGTPAGPLTPDDDRRERLADWLVRPDNRFFAASTVNRIWFHLLGQGIVDPVDDFRDTNPPSNPELLAELSKQFAQGGYRFKPVIRAIVNSRTYQLSSQRPEQVSPHAADGHRYFTHCGLRMLSAEQILDGISSATGVPEQFKGYPAGTRAIELAEGAVDNFFLMAFSKPVRDVGCDCAREEEPSLNQVIHLLNNQGVLDRVRSSKSKLAGWLAEGLEANQIVEQIYLSTLCRRPTPRELEIVAGLLATVPDRALALQDVQHALFNSNEFLLRH